MCRAIWVLAVGPTEEACARIRAMVGVDAQVVGEATDSDQAKGLAAELQFDVAVVDGRTPDAANVIELLRSARPGLAVVWIGESAPAQTHATVSPERLSDDLPNGIVRAIVQRR